MDNNKFGINLQLFADGEPAGAEAPTSGVTTPVEPAKDYKAEYERLALEVEKQKKLKDDYAKESANYKKQLADKMTDEEKSATARKELEEHYANLEKELNNLKLEKEVLGCGFTKEESDKLFESNFSVKAYSEILAKRIEENTKIVKATLIKETTLEKELGSGTATDQKSDFAKYEEEKAKNEVTGRVEL